MRPNYKALAEEYRKKYLAEKQISGVYQYEQLRLSSSLREQEQETEKMKAKYAEALAKYAEAMDKLIDMQERIWMQGEERHCISHGFHPLCFD